MLYTEIDDNFNFEDLTPMDSIENNISEKSNPVNKKCDPIHQNRWCQCGVLKIVPVTNNK